MSRQKKSLINANINVIFYFASAVVAFFSRKIFLKYLGDDFVGITATIGNMLALMSIAELGVSSAVGISLYKPIFEKDKKTINEIISIFGFLWRKIGLAILGVAIFISFFFPYFFGKSEIPLPIVYALFYSFLTTSLLGYFTNYRQILVTSDQRNYIITLLYNLSVLLKTVLQMVLVIQYHSYYGWILLEVVFTVLYSIVLNLKIKKDYPWLKSNIKQGKNLFPKYKFLWVQTKEIFAHKISHLVLNETDTILIYSFSSLASVAAFGNYTLIATKLGSLFEVLFTGVAAGIGNLIQEKDKQKIKKIFWEINSFRYFMAGSLVTILYFSMEPIISLWLGHQYVMDKTVLILILVNLYFTQISSTVDMFKSSYGLFQDVWAPITEVILNLIISLVFGYFLGITGVLLGTAISMLILKIIWKPYFLYAKGFNEPVIGFWRIVVKYIIGLALSFLLVYFIAPSFELLDIHQLVGFFVYASLVSISSIFIYGIFLYAIDEDFRSFILRILKLLPFNKFNLLKK